MATHLATERKPGAAFNDQRVEELAQALAVGMTVPVAAAQAGISASAAVKLAKSDEFRARLAELRTKTATFTTMSLASIASELEATAKEARTEKQYKSAIEAYKLLREMLKADADQLSGIGRALPALAADRRDELSRRLRASAEPLVVRGEPVDDDDEDAA